MHRFLDGILAPIFVAAIGFEVNFALRCFHARRSVGLVQIPIMRFETLGRSAGHIRSVRFDKVDAAPLLVRASCSQRC